MYCMPHAQDRNDRRRRQSAGSHLCFYLPRYDRKIQSPKSVYFVPCGQVYRVGERRITALAGGVAVANGLTAARQGSYFAVPVLPLALRPKTRARAWPV